MYTEITHRWKQVNKIYLNLLTMCTFIYKKRQVPQYQMNWLLFSFMHAALDVIEKF